MKPATSEKPGVEDTGTPRRAEHSPFLPILLLAVTVLGATTFQTILLFSGRNSLTQAITAQDTQMEQSKKVRAALESIATRTARFAKAGNANATVIVEELRKRGFTISSDGESPAQ